VKGIEFRMGRFQPRERTVVYNRFRPRAEPEGSTGGRPGVGDSREDRNRGAEGVLISPGMLKLASHLFAFRGAPVPVLRAG
jgi:hypothetical protein